MVRRPVPHPRNSILIRIVVGVLADQWFLHIELTAARSMEIPTETLPITFTSFEWSFLGAPMRGELLRPPDCKRCKTDLSDLNT